MGRRDLRRAGNRSILLLPRTPVQVSGLTGITAITTTAFAAFAVRGDGTPWAWGRGLAGELGNGTFPDISTIPVRVAAPSGVRAIAGGTSTVHVIANQLSAS